MKVLEKDCQIGMDFFHCCRYYYRRTVYICTSIISFDSRRTYATSRLCKISFTVSLSTGSWTIVFRRLFTFPSTALLSTNIALIILNLKILFKSNWVILKYATNHNHPQPPTTTYNPPEPATTTQNHPQKQKTTYNHQQPPQNLPTTIHNLIPPSITTNNHTKRHKIIQNYPKNDLQPFKTIHNHPNI